MARYDGDTASFEVAVGRYAVRGYLDGLPDLERYARHASLVDRFESPLQGGRTRSVTVRRGDEDWPFLVVVQQFAPPGVGFDPGVLIAEDVDRLFVGAGERTLAYDLAAPRRLWEGGAELGFFRWTRHGDVVVMTAEVEMAAWTVRGEKLWTTFVEPPWGYRVRDGEVELEVMSTPVRFPLLRGPDWGGRLPWSRS